MPEEPPITRLMLADIEAIKKSLGDVLDIHLGWSLEGAHVERKKLAREFRPYLDAWSQGEAIGGEVFLDYAYTLAAIDAIIACLVDKQKAAEVTT